MEKRKRRRLTSMELSSVVPLFLFLLQSTAIWLLLVPVNPLLFLLCVVSRLGLLPATLLLIVVVLRTQHRLPLCVS